MSLCHVKRLPRVHQTWQIRDVTDLGLTFGRGHERLWRCSMASHSTAYFEHSLCFRHHLNGFSFWWENPCTSGSSFLLASEKSMISWTHSLTLKMEMGFGLMSNFCPVMCYVCFYEHRHTMEKEGYWNLNEFRWATFYPVSMNWPYQSSLVVSRTAQLHTHRYTDTHTYTHPESNEFRKWAPRGPKLMEKKVYSLRIQ